MSKLVHCSRRCWCLAACGLALVVLSFGSQRLAAAEPKTTDSSRPTTQFRRINVPAEKIETWPRDGEKYMPVEAHDFESWVRAANDNIDEINRATIEIAEYTASLDHNRLQGEGQWTIVLRGDRPAFLPLDDISLVLRDAHWQDTPQQPARIGMWGRGGNKPKRLGIEVRSSGVLKFRWHIQTHATDDQTEIPWRAPTANSVRLTLDLPEGKLPRIDDGVVLESTPRPSDDRIPGKPLRRWVIALSPSPETNLRMVNADRKVPPVSAQLTMQENVNYYVGPRGLEMTATWQLDRPAEQKKELSIAVPAGTQLTSLKADSRDLVWRMVRDTSSPTDTALIELPKTDSFKPLQITFNAWQPSVLDAPWRLPRFRAEGVLWTAGKFEVAVAPGFELQRLDPKDCIETGITLASSATNHQETHSFTAFTQSAAVEINLSRRQSSATIRAGSSLALADPDLNGKLISKWNLADGSTHQLTGKLAPGWIVEAVETTPADAIAEWFIDRHGEERRIEIQLSRAASVERNVSVIITARLQRFSLAEPISADTMRIVTWLNARTAKHLLTFQSNDPYAIEPMGAMQAIARDAIDNGDLNLLDQTMDNKIFDITTAGKDAGLQLAFRRGQYAAHIDHEIFYENEALRHEYRVTAEPDSNPIDRLIVFSSNQLGEDVRWTDRASNAPLAAERLPNDDVQRAKLPKEGEAWLLRFPQPTARQIEIIASVSTRLTKRSLVPLFYLPEATHQDARILVRTHNQNSIWLESSHIQPIPLPHEARESRGLASRPSVCAAYRYQPADCRDAARSPKLWATSTSQGLNAVTARHIQLESYFWPDGSGTHSVTYQLENRGAPELKIAVPESTRLTTASLDGAPLDVAAPTGNGQPATIRLPPLARSTKLSLYFETLGPPLKAGRELTAPLVLNEVPFLAGDWVVWLPEEYSVMGTGLSSSRPEFNWRRRLFGLLGRPAGARQFNPLRLADSAALINSLADGTVIEAQSESSQQQPQTKAMPTTGWRRYHESFVANGPAIIVVMHPPTTTAWAVAILLTCLLCGRWLHRRQPEVFAIALAIAAAVALLLPAAYADLAAGAVLGLLLALVADLARRSISSDERNSLSRVKTAVATALTVTIIVALTKPSSAEPPNNDGRTPNPIANIYRVLIPTGADGRPSGTKLYLSEKFLRTLIAKESEFALAERQWLLYEASFSGELTDKPGNTDIGPGNWTMSFSIETLARDTTVVLPLIANEANWSTTAMLDGVPLPLNWRDGGRACAIEIAEPGRYSLAVSCVPKTTLAGGRNQLTIAIPSLPGSKVEVRAPETTTGLSVSHASVLRTPSEASNIFSAELDGTEQLKIQWSRLEKPESGKQGFNLTELRWLDIKPTDIELKVKFVLEGGARRPDSLAIAYDSRWKLLTDQKSITNEPGNTGGEQAVRVALPPQLADRQEILLRWRLTDPLSLGNLRLPPIELTSVPSNNRWLAISIDPSRQCEIPDASATEATANEFLAKWGETDAEAEPQLVLSGLESGAVPVVAIHPRETEPAVEEVVNVAAGLRALRVNYDAKVSPGDSGACQFELLVPADLSVDQITVVGDDRLVPLRWSRPGKNRVTVFFGRKIDKAFRLTVNGSTPLDATGSANLPHISTRATEGVTQKIQLYRDDDVQVVLGAASAAPESKTEPIDPPPSQWTVRPIGVYFIDNSSATTARIIVKPNDSKFAGDTLTALTRENGSWSATYRCQLLVEGGELDVLRLRVPSTWTGPFDVQSTLPVSTELTFIDEQSAILLIRFATSVGKGKAVDLKVRSPLVTSSGPDVSVPAVVLESFSGGHRYVSVPQMIDSQPILWSEMGVRPANVSQKLLAGMTASFPAYTFEVVNDPFQVASRVQNVPEAAPQIRLADTAIVAGDSGAQLIVTRLILAPRGLIACTLQLPSDQTLVTARLDSRPALLRPLDQTHWKLALSASQLPQVIEIVSRSVARNVPGHRSELQRPTLLNDRKPIPAEVSLWSFAHPQKSARPTIDSADEVSAREQAASRFDRLMSIAEVAKTAATELPSPDGFNWFEPWARLLADAQSNLQQTTAAPNSERPESQVSRASEEEISLAVKRFEIWLEDCRKRLTGPATKDEGVQSAADDFSLSSILATPGTGRWTFYVAEGGDDRLATQVQLVPATLGQIQFIGLLLIISLLIAAIWLMRWPAASDFLCRWPHTIGVMMGIAWWAWLWPSWLGIIIVAASIWLALRFDWPGRSIRMEASTVLRSTRTI